MFILFHNNFESVEQPLCKETVWATVCCELLLLKFQNLLLAGALRLSLTTFVECEGMFLTLKRVHEATKQTLNGLKDRKFEGKLSTRAVWSLHEQKRKRKNQDFTDSVFLQGCLTTVVAHSQNQWLPVFLGLCSGSRPIRNNLFFSIITVTNMDHSPRQ